MPNFEEITGVVSEEAAKKVVEVGALEVENLEAQANDLIESMGGDLDLAKQEALDTGNSVLAKKVEVMKNIANTEAAEVKAEKLGDQIGRREAGSINLDETPIEDRTDEDAAQADKILEEINNLH